jgi:nucleoside-diphosphate-sugar epimerase
MAATNDSSPRPGLSKAVVTGAAGFIGSHLCELLLARGARVVGVDSFSEHYATHLKLLNLEGAEGHPSFSLLEGDLAEADLSDAFADADVVFHLAARPGVGDSWENFQEYVDSNVVGSKRVFEAAVQSRSRVVYASSSSVYGDAPRLPAAEDDRLNPISPYAASKVMTEALANVFASSCGLDAVGLRYFSVYGPRQRPDMAISRFVGAIEDGGEVTVYGDGLQRRDMTFVGDVVEGTLQAAEHGRPGGVYNIASGRPTALIEILEELGDVMGLPVNLTRVGNRLGDVRATWGDVARASAELGYAPRTSLREGLEAQVEEARRLLVPAQRERGDV